MRLEPTTFSRATIRGDSLQCVLMRPDIRLFNGFPVILVTRLFAAY